MGHERKKRGNSVRMSAERRLEEDDKLQFSFSSSWLRKPTCKMTESTFNLPGDALATQMCVGTQPI
eukprot:scaffold10753_cov87-Skeletonema_marinoi.AAC.4